MNDYTHVVRILSNMIENDRHLDECFSPDDSPFIQQICYGVVRYFYYLDEVTSHLLDKPLADKHRDVHLLILAGLYSIDHLNRPAHTSVNATVEATRSLKKPWARGLVNAVLRRYGREKEKVAQLANKNSEAQYNHPDWLIELLNRHYVDSERILEANNSRAPMTLRVNLGKTSRDAYLELLAGEGISATPGALAATAVILAAPLPVDALPGFGEGLASVQDEAPQLTPTLMNLKPGQEVLDACAAPGGKTCHLLEHCPELSLTAIDRDRKRVGRIDENLNRLSLNAEVICTSLEELPGTKTFDRILLDVPCSATGIIRRHPDIKLLRTKSDVDKLSSVQRVLIDKAFDLLKVGGELLYSTCSILPSENDDVIADFLLRQPAAELVQLDAPANDVAVTTHGLQLLPVESSHDGFYYSAIRRRQDSSQ